MIVRRIHPMSLAKISGALYGLMGLILGAILSLVSVVGVAFAPKETGFGGMLFGVAAIVVLPILYGLLGFIAALIGAAFYNLVAGWVGGIELDVQ